MEPVGQIGNVIRDRIELLGGEILDLAEEARSILANAGLSKSDKDAAIDAARQRLESHMEAAFGDGEGSIKSEIQQLVASAEARIAGKMRMAAAIWLEELPGLRKYLEYCAEMIESHPGEMSTEIKESQLCLTRADVVHEKVSARVEVETAGR